MGRNGGRRGPGIVKRANVPVVGGSEELAGFIVRYRKRSEDILHTQGADKTEKIPSLREGYLSFFEAALLTRYIRYRGFLPASTCELPLQTNPRRTHLPNAIFGTPFTQACPQDFTPY